MSIIDELITKIIQELQKCDDEALLDLILRVLQKSI